ncbi:UNVERIFIED_CONTAM: hypothetical protein Sradi_6119800 [Sesamum radiatum]|uniref:Uncharacterized protein n=1 Tax=Sesamum radiatum TaxID=300843 RepID=A0AAW2KJB7_SESRA
MTGVRQLKESSSIMTSSVTTPLGALRKPGTGHLDAPFENTPGEQAIKEGYPSRAGRASPIFIGPQTHRKRVLSPPPQVHWHLVEPPHILVLSPL